MPPIDAPQAAIFLELEYTCTQDEMREGQAVGLYDLLGRGSKWRTWLVVYGCTTLILASVLDSHMKAFPLPQRLLLIAGISAGVVALLPLLGRFLRFPLVSTRLVASGRGLLVETNDSCITLPWTSFSRILETSGLVMLMYQKNQQALVIPKRAFPNEEAVQALRSMVAQRPKTPAPPSCALPSDAPGDSSAAITVQPAPSFADFLDVYASSWRYRLPVAFVATIMIGQTLLSDNEEALKVLPIQLGLLAGGLSVAVIFWVVVLVRKHRGNPHPTRYILDARGIQSHGADGSARVEWTESFRYLETRRNFFVWKTFGSPPIMLPKDSFASPGDVENARNLLSTHLKRSRWVMG